MDGGVMLAWAAWACVLCVIAAGVSVTFLFPGLPAGPGVFKLPPELGWLALGATIVGVFFTVTPISGR